MGLSAAVLGGFWMVFSWGGCPEACEMTECPCHPQKNCHNDQVITHAKKRFVSDCQKPMSPTHGPCQAAHSRFDWFIFDAVEGVVKKPEPLSIFSNMVASSVVVMLLAMPRSFQGDC